MGSAGRQAYNRRMTTDGDDDPDVRALLADARRRRWAWLGVVLAAVAAGAAYPFWGKSDVRSALEADGYSDVEVELDGYFTYTFRARRAAATCTGTIERYPLHAHRTESCVETARQP